MLTIVQTTTKTLDHSAVADLISSFLRGRSAATMSAYRTNLDHFAQHITRTTGQAANPNTAAQTLLSHGSGPANALALEYKHAMVESNLAPATINQKLATLRSLCKLARMIGLTTWTLEVESVKLIPYRDTRGPQEAGFKKMIEQIRERKDPVGIRNYAILRLLHDLGLRRGEIAALDMEDLEIVKPDVENENTPQSTVAVRGKGNTEKTILTLPQPTVDALIVWIDVRGDNPGPLFVNFHCMKNTRGQRLTTNTIYRMVRDLGKKAGICRRVTPHGLRHTAITQAVVKCQRERMGIDAVREFSRHKNLNTVQIYVDRHENRQGKVAAMVAG